MTYKDNKYNVCHICSYYENPLFGELVEAQKEFSNPRVFYYQHEKHSFKNGGKEYVDRVACYRYWERIDFIKKQEKALNAYKRLYKQTNFQLNFAYSLFTNGYIAYQVKKEWQIPYVVMIQNTDINVFFKYIFWLRKVGINILLQANKVLVASKSYQNTLLEKYIPYEYRSKIEKKIEVIPYGISDFWKNRVNIEKKNSVDTLKIVSVGSIDRNKNHLLICSALEKMIKQDTLKKVTVDIIGKGVNRRIVKKLDNYSFVNYWSYMPKEELIKKYRQGDLFILLSKTETFGLVYAEALSQGLPVIYTKGQGFDEQFAEGVVGFHSNLEEEELIKKVKLILENYHSIQINCSEKSHKFFWSNIAPCYKKIYEEIIDE